MPLKNSFTSSRQPLTLAKFTASIQNISRYLAIRRSDLVGTNVRIRSTTSATLLSTYAALLSCKDTANSWFSPIFPCQVVGFPARVPSYELSTLLFHLCWGDMLPPVVRRSCSSHLQCLAELDNWQFLKNVSIGRFIFNTILCSSLMIFLHFFLPHEVILEGGKKKISTPVIHKCQ